MRILKLSESPKELFLIKQVLEKGKVLVLPCDTVYGLFSNASNEESVRKIFAIKEKDFKNPIGIYVKDIETAKNLAYIDPGRESLLNKFWPGKVTFIFKKRKEKLPYVGTEETIGIRIPNDNLFQGLFKIIDFPVAQTSANIAGQPAKTKFREVIREFEGEEEKPDIFFDAGDLPSAKASTVVDLTTEPPMVLREGEITEEEILGSL